LSSPFPFPDPPLSDGVVELRPWGEDDVPALVEALQDPQIPRWTRVPSPYTERDAREFLAGRAVPEASFAVVDATDGRLLGAIGLRRAGRRGGQAGYWVAAPERGRGVAVRALRLVAGWALGELDLDRVEVLVQVANRVSQRVPEKAGFRREGVRPQAIELGDGRADAVVFARERV
jgi:RimJ/RimL family protein N-acetyltransferase